MQSGYFETCQVSARGYAWAHLLALAGSDLQSLAIDALNHRVLIDPSVTTEKHGLKNLDFSEGS